MRGSPETLRLPPPPMGRSRKQLQCPTHRRSTHCDFLASTWIFASQTYLELLLDFEYYCLLHVHQHFRNTLFVLWPSTLLRITKSAGILIELIAFEHYLNSLCFMSSYTMWSNMDECPPTWLQSLHSARLCACVLYLVDAPSHVLLLLSF